MFYEGCTTKEIKAFQKLEDETFNFGKGEMHIEGWYPSEDKYYEKDLQKGQKLSKNMDKQGRSKDGRRVRPNQYERKEIGKRKLDKLYQECGWWVLADKGTHKKRYYLSKRRKIAKKLSNNKVRNYNGDLGNGARYRKFYDFWWEIL